LDYPILTRPLLDGGLFLHQDRKQKTPMSDQDLLEVSTLQHALTFLGIVLWVAMLFYLSW
jgi:hypothetical protein